MRSFLSLPGRSTKPREEGLTHVLDKGLGLRHVEDMLATASSYIDIVKFGWGTGYLTQNIEAKIEAYRAAGITTSLGGNPLDVDNTQGPVFEYQLLPQRLLMNH